MRILGINDSSHDAALAVIENGEILFAAHSERYNHQKNTYQIHPELLHEALDYGPPDQIAYFEKRNQKRLRTLLHGGLNGQYHHLYKNLYKQITRHPPKEKQHPHHYSHAAGGYYTSPYEHATIIVIDAIGEFETTSIWDANGNTIKKRATWRYPFSYGLFYSAFTHYIGLQPGQDEYILMGMAAYGDPNRHHKLITNYFPTWNKQTYNFHKGIQNLNKTKYLTNQQDQFDIAAAVQRVYTERLTELMQHTHKNSPSKNLIYTGGCALNCAANTHLLPIWNNIWIPPNPGDAGSSLGAALATAGHHHNWKGPYLGHNIPGKYPTNKALQTLKTTGICAIANGPAEYGPRALGNRSLLADPRNPQTKTHINNTKNRQQYRPLSPIILQEHAHHYYNTPPNGTPYMQYTLKALQPHLHPATIHHDGTSRPQTINKTQHPQLHQLLTQWHQHTGIPILLNTSLNTRNQPILNNLNDTKHWQQQHPNIPLHTHDN